MTKFFSPSTGGFYDAALHAAMPGDVIEITAAEHRALLDRQSEGGTIAANGDGIPVATIPRVTIGDRRARLMSEVRSEASRRILAVAPIWRQINDVRDLAAADTAQHDAILARIAAIDAVRAASDVLEAAIVAMNSTQLAALDPADSTHWPN